MRPLAFPPDREDAVQAPPGMVAQLLQMKKSPGHAVQAPPGMVDLAALVTRYVEAVRAAGVDEPLTELYTLGWVLTDLCRMAGVPVPPALDGPHLEWMDEPAHA